MTYCNYGNNKGPFFPIFIFPHKNQVLHTDFTQVIDIDMKSVPTSVVSVGQS